MPTYIVQRPTLRHDGDDYEEGDTADMSEDAAQRLLALGAIEEAGDDPSEESSGGPSEELTEVVGTRQAGVLAEAGLPTIEAALGYEGDLTDIDGVGPATAEDLADVAE